MEMMTKMTTKNTIKIIISPRNLGLPGGGHSVGEARKKVLAPSGAGPKDPNKKQSFKCSGFLSLVLSFCTLDSFCISFVTRKSSWGGSCMPHLCLMYASCMPHLCLIYASSTPPPRVWKTLFRDLPGVPGTDSWFVGRMMYHTGPTKQELAHEHL